MTVTITLTVVPTHYGELENTPEAALAIANDMIGGAAAWPYEDGIAITCEGQTKEAEEV